MIAGLSACFMADNSISGNSLSEDIVSGEYAKRNLVPWINPAAMMYLESFVRPTWSVFEWGSGGSSIWWARHCTRVVTVEHRWGWHRWVTRTARALKLRNLEIIRASVENGDYVGVISRVKNPKFDCIVIDGEERMACLKAARGHLNSRGVILLDDSQRYEVPKWLKRWRTVVFDSPPFKGKVLEWQATFFHKSK